MTILEKITLQNNHCNYIYLFKEGVFYKAYNEGAFLLQETNYKVSAKYVKSVSSIVYSLGFPEVGLHKLKTYFNCSVVNDKIIKLTNKNVFFNMKAYKLWCTTNNRTVNSNQIILDKIKKYPLETKTPIEVYLWLFELQKKIT